MYHHARNLMQACVLSRAMAFCSLSATVTAMSAALCRSKPSQVIPCLDKEDEVEDAEEVDFEDIDS